MFESVCMRHTRLYENREPLDFGFLAELLLFYQNVHVVVDEGGLTQLARECGPSTLIELMEEEFLKVGYTNKVASIENIPALEILRPNTFWIRDGSLNLDQVAPQIFSKVAGGPGYGRQLGRRFAELASTFDYGSDYITAWRTDIVDADYVYPAVVESLRVIAPTYRVPRDFRFDVIPDEDFFRVETNLDFQAITDSFYARVGEPAPLYDGGIVSGAINAGNLLMYLVDARTELLHASRDSAELAANPLNAAIIAVKWRELLRRHEASQHEIETFQQDVLADGHEIAESIRNRYRTWPELLAVLRKARVSKFKGWLQQRSPDSSLIGEYYKALTRETWIKTLPAKAFRFTICTLAGLATPTPASIAISAADSFLVDRWLGGWKPNTFVNGSLKRFARLA